MLVRMSQRMSSWRHSLHCIASIKASVPVQPLVQNSFHVKPTQQSEVSSCCKKLVGALASGCRFLACKYMLQQEHAPAVFLPI